MTPQPPTTESGGTPETDAIFDAGEVSQVPCCKCRGPVIEFTVPNRVWNTVIRRSGPETDQEYLCKNCYIAAVSDYITEKGEAASQLETDRNQLREKLAEVTRERDEARRDGDSAYQTLVATAKEKTAAEAKLKAAVDALVAEDAWRNADGPESDRLRLHAANLRAAALKIARGES